MVECWAVGGCLCVGLSGGVCVLGCLGVGSLVCSIACTPTAVAAFGVFIRYIQTVNP